MRDIKWFVYEPLDWQKRVGYTVRKDNCRAQVHEAGRSVMFRQCMRKPTEIIDGYGFCKQHAKIIRENLELHKKGS